MLWDYLFIQRSWCNTELNCDLAYTCTQLNSYHKGEHVWIPLKQMKWDHISLVCDFGSHLLQLAGLCQGIKHYWFHWNLLPNNVSRIKMLQSVSSTHKNKMLNVHLETPATSLRFSASVCLMSVLYLGTEKIKKDKDGFQHRRHGITCTPSCSSIIIWINVVFEQQQTLRDSFFLKMVILPVNHLPGNTV